MPFVDLTKREKNWGCWLQAMVGCGGAAAIAIHYRIGFDLLLIFLLLFSSWCAGTMLPTDAKGWERELVRLACGMSMIGLILYGLLTLGWGGKTQYLLVLAVPISCWYFRGCEIPKHPIPKGRRFYFILWILAILAALFLVYASAPVSAYDAMTGHLPITMYGVRTGAFQTNIAESITYTQTGVFFYGFTILLASFGAYKAMSMLNAVLLFMIFAVLYMFSKKIYHKTSPFVLIILFFSVPMFFEFSTIMYVEMLPIFFAFSGFLLIAECKPEAGWKSMPVLALLFSCSLISKLTISYMILAGGLLAIVLFFLYAIKEKVPAWKIAARLLLSGILFLIITSMPYLLAWYRYGNPFFPLYNDIFCSPYFPAERFMDPFEVWQRQFGFSLRALLTIVFHTGQNIEMHDGGLGIFLLLLPLVPLSWLLHRKKPILIWGGLLFFTYGISTLLTWNLRYYMSIFMLACALISVGLCVLFQSLPHIRYGCVAVALAVALPGAIYIAVYFPLANHLTVVSNEISGGLYSDLLKEIPSGKRVIGSEPFKGDYDGYFASFNWHGSAWLNLIELEGVSIAEYVSCFDYLIWDSSINLGQDYLDDCQDSGLMELNLLDAQGPVELYQIQEKTHEVQVLSETFERPQQVALDAPYTKVFSIQDEGDVQIIQDMRNDGDNPVNVRFQINWLDGNGEFVTTSITTYTLQPGERSRESSDLITPPYGAVSGVLYLGPHDPNAVLSVYGYQLLQFQGTGYIFTHINSLIEERTYLAP